MIAIYSNTVCKRSPIVLSPDNYVMICGLLQTVHVTESARACVCLCGRVRIGQRVCTEVLFLPEFSCFAGREADEVHVSGERKGN